MRGNNTVRLLTRRNAIRAALISIPALWLGHVWFNASPWRLIRPRGLGRLGEWIKDLSFIDGKVGYAGGQFSDWSPHEPVIDAFMYRCDDRGRNWSHVPLPDGYRSVERIFPHPGGLVLLVTKPGRRDGWSVLRADSQGTWRETPFPVKKEGAPCHAKLHVSLQGRCTAVAWYMRKDCSIFPAAFRDGEAPGEWESIWTGTGKEGVCLTPGDGEIVMFAPGAFLACDTAGGAWREAPLPVAFKPDVGCCAAGVWRFAGLSDTGAAICTVRDGRASVHPVREAGGNPVISIDVLGDTICCDMIVAGSATFFGVTHEFLFSRDGGRTWRTCNYFSSLVTRPACFVGENSYLTVGLGGLQIFSLDA